MDAESPPKLTANGIIATRVGFVGRAAELDLLWRQYEEVTRGGCFVTLISGSVGAGKTALLRELKDRIEAHGGCFAMGKFDQSAENEAQPVIDALDDFANSVKVDERMALRSRILRELGSHAGLARIVPVFDQLLQDTPEVGRADPAHAAARMVELVAGLLRTAASAGRPLAFVLDDLQWSGALAARVFDSVLCSSRVPGLLLIGAYRDEELDADQPLRSFMARWQIEAWPMTFLRLEALETPKVALLLQEVLRASSSQALALAQDLAPYARGNPLEAIEFVSELCERGILIQDNGHLSWDRHSVHHCLVSMTYADAMRARMNRLPQNARHVIRVLACLGSETTQHLAQAACSLGPEGLRAAVEALVRHGFLLPDTARRGVLRLRHDTVRRCAQDSMTQAELPGFHLRLARRIPNERRFELIALEQYIAASDAITDPAECLQVASRLRSASAYAREIGNWRQAYRLIETALALIKRARGSPFADAGVELDCEIDFYLTSYGDGKLLQADAIYRALGDRITDPTRKVNCACIQVRSLSSRARYREALMLGLATLRELGFDLQMPFEDPARLTATWERIRRWAWTFDAKSAERAPPSESAQASLAGNLLRALRPPALHSLVPNAYPSLCVVAFELCEKFGFVPELAAVLCPANVMATVMRDWRTPYLVARHGLELSEMKGWQVAASEARRDLATLMHWFEPLERAIPELDRARVSLLRSGDHLYAALCDRHSVLAHLECCGHLRTCREEAEGAVRRATGEGDSFMSLADRRLVMGLQGDTRRPGEFHDAEADEARCQQQMAERPRELANYELRQSIFYAICADRTQMPRHALRALEVDQTEIFYSSALTRWLGAVAIAWNLQDGVADEGCQRRSQLDSLIEWLHARTVDAPFNFSHILLHAQAERAWALGDLVSASRLLDEAMDGAERNQRRWHQAFITERAARLQLALGRQAGAEQLLHEAQTLYATWGATARARALSSETQQPPNPLPQPLAQPTRAEGWLLEVALSLANERDITILKARVTEALREVLGATRAILVFREELTKEWAIQNKLPVSALRFTEHTHEPLLLADAAADERFGREPCFQGGDRCSLMVVPVIHGGNPLALLVLENRSARAAFSSASLEAVTAVAGLLAVSTENARLYERLEHTVREQKDLIEKAQSQLVDEAHKAGMAQVAINVLHNVGNVMTSVNVSAQSLTTCVRDSRIARVRDLADLVAEHEEDLGTFLTTDERGGMVRDYVRSLAEALTQERAEWLTELERIETNMADVRHVIATQQAFAARKRDVRLIEAGVREL